ncbi:hypothetical protein A3J78_02425, partial [Candidatus Beckwithbacteria bacterium RBG_13_35_6]
MIYSDRIFGKVKIDEPIILDLIASLNLQRLKQIDQAGYFEPFWPGTKHSRFEHSLGVYLLLRKYKASLAEQTAGLIHDVSHSAFSHCIDYVLKEGSPTHHDHQDNVFVKFVTNSGIPKILTKYAFKLDYILNEANFPLKERKLPDLCADRIDYLLRTALIVKEINKKFLKHLFDNFFIENNFWVFKNFALAKTYSLLFKKMNSNYFAGFASALMFATVGGFLKHALTNDYINNHDFYTTDNEVLEKIKPYLPQDKKLYLLWLRMNNKIKTWNRPLDYDTHVVVKSRVIDPLFKRGRKTLRLSDEWPEWKKILIEESKPKEYFIKFE